MSSVTPTQAGSSGCRTLRDKNEEGGQGRRSQHPRSLSSNLLLADKRRGSDGFHGFAQEEETGGEEVELESTSMLIALHDGDDIVSLFSRTEPSASGQQPPEGLSEARSKLVLASTSRQNGNHELLADLISPGFKSGVVLTSARATEMASSEKKTCRSAEGPVLGDEELELDEQQAWACLVQSSPTVGKRVGELPSGRPSEFPSTLPYYQVVGEFLRHPCLLSVNSNEQPVMEARRPSEFEHDDWFNKPSHCSTRHGREIAASIAARDGEGGLKRALERLVPRLLQREERRKQSLEAEKSRLGAELHRALGRSARLESKNRSMEALLAEAQANADGLIERNTSFEAELRHMGKLLANDEKERIRAWQTTNASTETAKASSRRADELAIENEILCSEIRGQEVHTTPALQDRRQSRVGKIEARLEEAKRLKWRKEQDLPETLRMERDRSRDRRHIPERVRSVHVAHYPIPGNARNDQYIQGWPGQLGDGKLSLDARLTPSPTGSLVLGTDRIGKNPPRRNSKRSSSDSARVREALTTITWEPVRTRAEDEEQVKSMREREQCHVGRKHRHESEGVKEALMMTKPGWTSSEGSTFTSGYGDREHRSRAQSMDDGRRQKGHSAFDKEGTDYRNGNQGCGKVNGNSYQDGQRTQHPQTVPAARQMRRPDLSTRVGMQIDARASWVNPDGTEMKHIPWSDDREHGGETDGSEEEIGRRQSIDSAAARDATPSLAILLGKTGAVVPEGGGRPRLERASAPFATDAMDEELRPMREVERQLMLVQMSISQLEAEQGKLIPKTRKTMQARIKVREIDNRLARLMEESSRLRRILREKPWRA